MTTAAMGLWGKIAELSGVTVIDPYQPGCSPEEALELRRQGMLADVMIVSSNVITHDGRLVNLDGSGNRVAAMAFGPDFGCAGSLHGRLRHQKAAWMSRT